MRIDFDPIVHHFSHEHPLKWMNLQDQTIKTVTCSACEFEASEWVYGCDICNYFLHKPCSKMPQILNHPFDPDHTLLLFLKPVYPAGIFLCDACGETGTGFSYHCTECEIDLHNLCAFMPTSVDHSSHRHTLNLWSSSSYNEFMCDICKHLGSKWLFRCSFCQFDAHISCALVDNNKGEQDELGERHNSRTNPPEPVHSFSSRRQEEIPSPWIRTQYAIPRTTFSHDWQPVGRLYDYRRDSIPQFTRASGSTGVMGHFVEGLVDGMAQQAGMAVLQGFLGGFLGGL